MDIYNGLFGKIQKAIYKLLELIELELMNLNLISLIVIKRFKLVLLNHTRDKI